MRAILTTPKGTTVKFNGNTCKVIAILDALRRAARPLRVKEILEMTPEDGVLMTNKDPEAEASMILSKLKDAGAVHNPTGMQAPTRHYCLTGGVKIEITLA